MYDFNTITVMFQNENDTTGIANGIVYQHLFLKTSLTVLTAQAGNQSFCITHSFYHFRKNIIG